MATVTEVWKSVGLSAETLARNAGNAFERLGGTAGSAASGSASLAESMGRGVVGMLKLPVKWVGYGVNVPIKVLSGTFRVGGPVAAGVTVLGGAMIAGNWLKGRAERRTQNEILMQAAEMQAMAQQRQSAYMNSVTPAETQALNTRIAEQAANQNHGEAVRVAEQAAPAKVAAL